MLPFGTANTLATPEDLLDQRYRKFGTIVTLTPRYPLCLQGWPTAAGKPKMRVQFRSPAETPSLCPYRTPCALFLLLRTVDTDLTTAVKLPDFGGFTGPGLTSLSMGIGSRCTVQRLEGPANVCAHGSREQQCRTTVIMIGIEPRRILSRKSEIKRITDRKEI